MDVSESMDPVHALIEVTQAGCRLGDQALMNAALASLRSRSKDGRVDVDEWIRAIYEVYASATNVQDTSAICEDVVKPLKGGLLVAGLQHVDALMSLEEGTFEKALQASEWLRYDWSRALE